MDRVQSGFEVRTARPFHNNYRCQSILALRKALKWSSHSLEKDVSTPVLSSQTVKIALQQHIAFV